MKEAVRGSQFIEAGKGAATGVAAFSPSPEPPKHVLAHKEQRNAWWYFVCVCGAEIGPYFNEDYGSDAFEVHVAAPAVSPSPEPQGDAVTRRCHYQSVAWRCVLQEGHKGGCQPVADWSFDEMKKWNELYDKIPQERRDTIEARVAEDKAAIAAPAVSPEPTPAGARECWIPVSEKLPDGEQGYWTDPVLLHYENGTIAIDTYYHALGQHRHGFWRNDPTYSKPTHWQPLPAPPGAADSRTPATAEVLPAAYMCPNACGCLWRDNHDGTMSLYGPNSRSCDKCEVMPLDQLAPLFVRPMSLQTSSLPDFKFAVLIPGIPAPAQ